MNKPKKVKYTNEPIGKIRNIPDFLPSPKHLVLQEETVKVTLALTKDSLDFFKEAAETHHTQYQKMIRSLLEHYANYYRYQKRKA